MSNLFKKFCQTVVLIPVVAFSLLGLANISSANLNVFAASTNTCTSSNVTTVTTCATTNMNTSAASDDGYIYVRYSNASSVFPADGYIDVNIIKDNTTSSPNPTDLFDIISVTDVYTVGGGSQQTVTVNQTNTVKNVSNNWRIRFVPANTSWPDTNPADGQADFCVPDINGDCPTSGLPTVPASTTGYVAIQIRLKANAPAGAFNLSQGSSGRFFYPASGQNVTLPWTIAGTVPTPSCSNGATNYPTCNQCPSGQVLAGGSCVNQCSNGAINPTTCDQCNVGFNYVGGSCVPTTCSNGATNAPNCNQCPSGQTYNGSQCVLSQCTNGATNPSACNQCPSGKTFVGGSCVTSSTTAGNANSGSTGSNTPRSGGQSLAPIVIGVALSSVIALATAVVIYKRRAFKKVQMN